MSDNLDYQVRLPPKQLEEFVDCFWDLSGPSSNQSPDSEIILPDGKTELIVHFGDDFLKLETNEKTGIEIFERQARVLMSGQLTSRIKLRPTGVVGVSSIRFKAAGAARFFDLPFESIVDQVVDFSSYHFEVATMLKNNIESATNCEARLLVLQELLIQRLQIQESKEDVFVRQACRYITESEGGYSVAELVKLIGFSERQLERKFKNQVGITPKLLSRIMRFQKFIRIARDNPKLTLTDASLSCGYFDQSHFIRDFTKFAGVSPVNYLTSPHAMSDHFATPISEK